MNFVECIVETEAGADGYSGGRRYDGDVVLLNLDHVVSVTQIEEGSRLEVTMVHGATYRVRSTLRELQDAMRALR